MSPAGTEDDGSPGGRGPGEALRSQAERDLGGPGLSGLSAGPGRPGPRPVPHQGGLQRVR